LFHGFSVIGAALDQAQASNDSLQHVVEIMRNAPGELA
jgi:hypothetical protein